MIKSSMTEFNYHDVHKKFKELYSTEPLLIRSPARINLIGEHTDYNDGFVLPAAIDRDVVLVATPRPDRRLRLPSLNMEGLAELDLDELGPSGAWHDYAAGVAAIMQREGYRLFGLDATIA